MRIIVTLRKSDSEKELFFVASDSDEWIADVGKWTWRSKADAKPEDIHRACLVLRDLVAQHCEDIEAIESPHRCRSSRSRSIRRWRSAEWSSENSL